MAAWPHASRSALGTRSDREALDREALDRKAFMGRGMEHLLGRDQPRRQAFRVMVAQKGLEYLAVGRKPVRPEVVPHQLARRPELLVHERQRALAGGGVLELL